MTQKQASDARLRAEKRAIKHCTHWIGGKPWDGEAERHGDVYDPATGQVSGQVDFAAPAEVDLAVEAAKDAFQTWRRASLAKRASVLFAFRELIRSHAEPDSATDHRGARQGGLGRGGRGGPRP